MKRKRAWRFWRPKAPLSVALSIALTVVVLPSAQGEDLRDHYQATVIVTGTDMRSRPTGFAQCLREVLVKLSGEPRLRNDPRVSKLAADADALVTTFSYVDPRASQKVKDDQGTYDRSYNLTVHFDPTRIDKALANLGERPWRGERPEIVPVLAVRGFASSYLLSANNSAGAEQRGAFVDVARDFDMRVRFPSEAELVGWGVTLVRFSSPQIASSPDQAFVAGTLEFDSTLPGWVGSWRMRWQGTDYEWKISGVNYDEAFRDIVRGVMRVASGHGAPT